MPHRRHAPAVLLAIASVANGQDTVLRFPEPIDPVQVWSGAQTGIADTRYLVIGSQKQWRALWREHDPDAEVPAVDFGTEMVLGVFNPPTTDRGFRIDRVARGTLTSDLWSLNVLLEAPAANPTSPNRFVLARTARTRLEFRFYLKGTKDTASRARLVARRICRPKLTTPESLLDTARSLMDDVEAAQTPVDRAKILAQLATIGDPLRPMLHDLIAGSSFGERWTTARAVLDRMFDDEVQARGLPVRHREIALGKAIAEARERTDFEGAPWWVSSHTVCRDGLWFVTVHGSFAFSSDWQVASQPGIDVRIAIRAADGALLHRDITRDGVGGVVEREAPIKKRDR